MRVALQPPVARRACPPKFGDRPSVSRLKEECPHDNGEADRLPPEPLHEQHAHLAPRRRQEFFSRLRRAPRLQAGIASARRRSFSVRGRKRQAEAPPRSPEEQAARRLRIAAASTSRSPRDMASAHARLRRRAAPAHGRRPAPEVMRCCSCCLRGRCWMPDADAALSPRTRPVARFQAAGMAAGDEKCMRAQASRAPAAPQRKSPAHACSRY